MGSRVCLHTPCASAQVPNLPYGFTHTKSWMKLAWMESYSPSNSIKATTGHQGRSHIKKRENNYVLLQTEANGSGNHFCCCMPLLLYLVLVTPVNSHLTLAIHGLLVFPPPKPPSLLFFSLPSAPSQTLGACPTTGQLSCQHETPFSLPSFYLSSLFLPPLSPISLPAKPSIKRHAHRSPQAPSGMMNRSIFPLSSLCLLPFLTPWPMSL